MTSAELEGSRPIPTRYRPWLQRHIDASGLALGVVGAGIALAHLASFFGWMALGWALGVGSPEDAWFWEQMVGPNVIMAALIGWVPAAMAWSHRRAARELAALRPLLGANATAFEARFAAFPRLPMALLGGALAVLVLPIIYFDPGMGTGFALASDFGRAWMIWVNGVVGWHVTRGVLEELRVAMLFRDAGSSIEAPDLFDLAPLEPFARRAVEGVLPGIVCAALLSLIFAGEGWASTTLPFLVTLIAIPAGVAFMLPLLGIHRRIRAAKQEELARVHARARADRDALLAGGAEAAEAAARLPALLALRAQVSHVREWPVDLPTFARLAGFLAIGLASWVGAALVDVGIEVALR